MKKSTISKMGVSIGFAAFLLLSGTFLLGVSAKAVTQSKSGDITVSGLVAGPPPSTAPTIDYPPNNTTFDTKRITVKGDCIAGYIVKVFRNDIFVGSTLCQSDGRYELPIDLAVAKNDLVARQYDIANQASPASEVVVVYYVPQSTNVIVSPEATQENNAISGANGAGPTAIANFQLTINYDYTLQGIFVGQAFRLPVSFSGGSAPYAVSIDWGDGNSSLYSRQDSSVFPTDHIYKQPGFKTVTVKVSDAKGDEAYLQFVILVNGEASPVTRQLFGTPHVIELWPIVVISLLVGLLLGLMGCYVIRRWLHKRTKKHKKA